MPVSIIDSLTTITEVCLLQGHNMNSMTDASSARIFSDDQISTVINNVIRFVYGNSRSDLDAYLKLMIVNTLSTIALNNIMAEAGYLPNWQYVDPFDKLKFYEMIQQIKEDDKGSDNISIYRDSSKMYEYV